MFSMIAPFAFKLFGWILDKVKAGEETRRLFREMQAAAQAEGIIPLKLKQSADDQLARIKDDLWREELAKREKEKAAKPDAP